MNRGARPGARFVAALLAVWLAAHPARAAEEDKDLELIPPTTQQAPPAPAPATTNGGSQINYLEDAFTGTLIRGSLAVTYPPPPPATWQDRLFLDSRDEWRLGDGVTLTYSGRFNLEVASNLPFPDHENVRNDLRELFISWQPADGTWIDLGRINLKSGVAVGYNPTDFFRSRAVVEPLTADPTVLREDRLGTLMLMGQHVWPGGSITAAYAPKVTLPTAIYNDTNLPSFDPMLDRTNSENRFLLKASLDLGSGFSIDPLFYHTDSQTQFGANLSAGLGQQTVLYLEWAGGVSPSLLDSALVYGQQTGTLPRTGRSVLPVDTDQYFRNELAAGFSYVPVDTKLTLNLEYHYDQAGFSAQDWRNWFNAGARYGAIPGVDATLWYVRSYAQDQQQPMSRHTAFLRADWTDAFVPDLELTALATVDLEDGSGLVQATADYYLSRAWTVGGLLDFTFGGRRSDFGSLPQAGGILLRLVRYL
jgi:hypothetical protein